LGKEKQNRALHYIGKQDAAIRSHFPEMAPETDSLTLIGAIIFSFQIRDATVMRPEAKGGEAGAPAAAGAG